MRTWMQHHLNVIHVYCRLVDLGISKKRARSICTTIEPILKVTYIHLKVR